MNMNNNKNNRNDSFEDDSDRNQVEDDLDSPDCPFSDEWERRHPKPKPQPPKPKREARKFLEPDEIPDFGKYHPNYKPIFPRSPAYKICEPIKEKLEQDHENRYGTKKKRALTLQAEANSNKKKQKNSLPNIDLFTKRNRCIRFSQYPKRKPIYSIAELDKLSYEEPYNYLDHIAHSPDFKKMKPRAEHGLVNMATINMPSICHYEPKYSQIEKKLPKALFNNNDKAPIDKKVKMRRLWTDYDVTSDYKMVEFKEPEKLDEFGNAIQEKTRKMPLNIEELCDEYEKKRLANLPKKKPIDILLEAQTEE